MEEEILREIRFAETLANQTQRPTAIVSTPNGRIQAVQLAHANHINILEIQNPTEGYTIEPDNRV